MIMAMKKNTPDLADQLLLKIGTVRSVGESVSAGLDWHLVAVGYELLQGSHLLVDPVSSPLQASEKQQWRQSGQVRS
jgi:hypothetical protein